MRMRYRRPSLNTLLGVTKAKRRFKKSLGIYKVTGILNAPKNARRRLRRRLGMESELAKFMRFLGRFLGRILRTR